MAVRLGAACSGDGEREWRRGDKEGEPTFDRSGEVVKSDPAGEEISAVLIHGRRTLA
jgi:hypothetical protein